MPQLMEPSPGPPAYRVAGPRPLAPRTPSAPCVASVLGFETRGRVLVAIPGLDQVMTARRLKGIGRAELMDPGGLGQEVLVVFEGGSPERPIIVGVLESEAGEVDGGIEGIAGREREPATPRHEKVLIEALAELVLKCGAGSITLRRDGKIILRGTHLLARASGPVRIKGGHVEIN
jgi:hypothetical protein